MRHEYVEIVWVASPATKPDHPPTSPGERWAYVAAVLLVILGVFCVYRTVTSPSTQPASTHAGPTYGPNPPAEQQKRVSFLPTDGTTPSPFPIDNTKPSPFPTEELLPDRRSVP